MGTWVWDKSTVLAADARRDLLAFARAKDVDTLYVHAASDFDQDPGFEALATLVTAAAAQGVSITLVAGDPSWSRASHYADALAFLERVGRIHARLAARGLPSTDRVLFDVEPYLLPEWRAAPAGTIAAYVGLLRALHKAGRVAALDVWHTIPFWFPEHQMNGETLDQIVLEQSAGVVLMAYRNREDDVRSLASPVLARAAKLGRPVMVAVETMCIDPRFVTFCGQTPEQLGAALRNIAVALLSSRAFAGLAVHHYTSWAKLDGRVR